MKPTILSRHKLTTSIATGATVIVLATGGYAVANSGSSTSANTAAATSTSATSGQLVSGSRGSSARSGGSNARSGPAAGGASGTVDSVSTSSFTISTPAGQKVTVNKASSTTYQKGTSSISASAITQGESVLVLGTTSGTTITASQVIVQPTNSGGSAASTAAGVVPFQRGAPSTSKQVGQIPANYSQGSGTIVSGTAANKATEAALASYPGGVVDRVVQLSNGEYEVHNIGVNWPHHVFVNQDFKVVGAN
jgi:membrane-bound inhibitor of C-type lysozyme